MADNEKNEKPKAPGNQDRLSEEMVNQTKAEILFGVGYRKPPKEGQFRKGQSGNPAGRPKRRDIGLGNSRSVNVLAFKEGERPITIREGDATKETTEIEAVIRKQYATALAGNAYSLKHVIQRHDWAERERRQQRMNEIDIWQEYIAEKRQLIAEALARGEPEPVVLPHPDDIVIDYEKGARFIGPVDEASLASLNESLKIRDMLIMQDALDQRGPDANPNGDVLDRPGALLLAMLVNNIVPERHRLSDLEFQIRAVRYASTPKRKLLKMVYQGWREIGPPMPRGKTYPSGRILKQRLDQFTDCLRGLSAS